MGHGLSIAEDLGVCVYFPSDRDVFLGCSSATMMTITGGTVCKNPEIERKMPSMKGDSGRPRIRTGTRNRNRQNHLNQEPQVSVATPASLAVCANFGR